MIRLKNGKGLRVEEKQIKFRLICNKLFRSGCAGGNIAEIKFDEIYAVFPSDVLQSFDCWKTLFLVSRTEVHLRVVLKKTLLRQSHASCEEHFASLPSKASVASSNDGNLSCEVGHVRCRPLRLTRKDLLEESQERRHDELSDHAIE